MIICYARSSSLKDIEYCEQKYFINYNLGIKEPANKKAVMGTIAHKVLEWLALCKLNDAKQIKFFDDSLNEEMSFNRELLYSPTTLAEETVKQINKTRANKDIYKSSCLLEGQVTRLGYEIVNDMVIKSFNYYSAKYPYDWTVSDLKNCGNWVWMALEWNNGHYDPRNLKIISPEQQFDMKVDKEWATYDYDIGGEKISGNFAIKGTVDLITELDSDTIEIIDWKGLPVETLIPTPNGWSTMGELKVGDIVFDELGKQTKIIGKSPLFHKECYRIYFDDTSIAECDEDHLWKLSNNKTVSILDLKVGDKINVAGPIETDSVSLPIDPYVLGIWLGDGRNKNGEVCNSDEFVFNEIIKRGYSVGNDISGGGCPSRTIYNLVPELKKLNLLHNKHIPSVYLRASYNQRLDLLRGLMDTDGNVNHTRKQTVFTNCNEKLSTDCKELLLSLGQRPLLSHVKHKYLDGYVDVYPVSFRPININPFLLPVKSKKIDGGWGVGRSSKRKIIQIENIGKLDTQCISVESKCHTFLCTENMIPTHNTGQRKNWATGQEKTYEDLCSDIQLALYHYAVSRLYPSYKHVLLTIFFVRDGGPFTVTFDTDNVENVETTLKNHFEYIKNNKIPKLRSPTQSDFQCKKLCGFYKQNWPGSEQNICRFIHNEVKRVGMDNVINTYKQKDHYFAKYQNPGE